MHLQIISFLMCLSPATHPLFSDLVILKLRELQVSVTDFQPESAKHVTKPGEKYCPFLSSMHNRDAVRLGDSLVGNYF